MFTESYMDSLNLISADDFRLRIPRFMNVPGVIDDGGGDQTASFTPSARRIIVSNELPIKSNFDEVTKIWRFNLDQDSLVLQLKDGFGSNTEVYYVGTLKGADVEVKDQELVSQFLYENYKCVPVFLNLEMHTRFYHGFCKHYLWPLFHYMLPITPSHGGRFDRTQWQSYVAANKVFADKVKEVLNPDEDFVWIHDYHLMVLPTLLRKKYHRIKVGFFLHSPFPSSEIYRTIPVREEILRGFLNCDLVGFHTFDYARHFLSCCSRMLGLNYQSKRGHLGLDYFGRTVSVKILPVGIHTGQLESVLSMESTAKMARELKERYEGKIVIVGVDDLDMFKGISLKFLAMGRLLEDNKRLRGKVVLVQITNPARSQGKDVQDVETEAKLVLEQVNELYGTKDYQPIVYINRHVSTEEKAAYYAISECCMVSAVRDGMNLVSYKYTVCREGSPVLEDDEKYNPRKSVLIVSEFIGCSPSLSGAIRVNPWNVDAMADAMYQACGMREEEKHLRHEKHYKYISSHDVAYWARSFDQDLQRACQDHYSKRYWGVGYGLGFRIVALGPSFRKLAMEPIVKAYKETNSCRLILLDYDGTMKSSCSIDKAPRSDVISILNCLCSDPKNVVFVVSGRGKDSLSNWFSPCERLGISAEHGFFTRWTKDSEWEKCSMVIDDGWKKIAEPVMKLYTESTDGSFIEHKESALVWHYREADSHFGLSQAKELLDHLENVLANEPVVVKRGQEIVEVKPQGVSKGIVVENLISTMRSKGKLPDFVLCIGDDHSDEDMFESIANHVDNPSTPPIAEVFACTVGQKPSMAKYYLDDTSEVINLLSGLADSSQEEPKYAIP
ncbi:probable alpha,alpha-trehalose-phosphate synthase [UDP-forming] 11 [Mercurialis annua]|uniref:probable alpha,alpha-trehalose-phosphate synthase [UDP-forming] 11 n=1 Tax=Mercurialis annua TaxID=3986 RepID=UPI00215FD892|nr:probable alpha,alpha-trehalose-phosphate synthase [UDP-forming] 11 [Mercurialis annua]